MPRNTEIAPLCGLAESESGFQHELWIYTAKGQTFLNALYLQCMISGRKILNIGR